ncbi:hypothetical protein [Halodesulfovibrio marinisediminis]|uniref:Uncharacterized protein n=1 Tax=Halodesulfovibrio marinisediminis DSM 17456 TaxID=1121457 RepID=A0A1N6G0L5_9BACT|nr:hypothetical protein [Halodesulfovibrio marinisediminis]SIO01010.1 hypothetical protein SAMN02745161_1613 [Halodesulfovibrio marinisediminis DSM 17456]
MDLLVLGFCGLIFVCLVAGCNFFATTRMHDKINASKQARRALHNEVSELQAALISKREEKKIVINKLRMARAESSSQKEVVMDVNPSTPSRAQGNFEQELVSQKIITERELDRVKNYRRSTSCPYDVGETIIMLGYASQHDVDRVREKYS